MTLPRDVTGPTSRGIEYSDSSASQPCQDGALRLATSVASSIDLLRRSLLRFSPFTHIEVLPSVWGSCAAKMATRSAYRAPSLISLPQTQLLQCPRCRSFSSTPSISAGRINKAKVAAEKLRKKRKRNPYLKTYDLKEMQQFSLCDAMRYMINYSASSPHQSNISQ